MYGKSKSQQEVAPQMIGVETNEAERRKSPRIKLHCPVPYACLDETGKPIKLQMGTVLNLCQEGILLETTQWIEPGDIVLLKPGTVILITADEQNKNFEINGRAVYCHKTKVGNFFVGISFQGSHEENIQFVKCMVRAHYYGKTSTQLT